MLLVCWFLLVFDGDCSWSVKCSYVVILGLVWWRNFEVIVGGYGFSVGVLLVVN